ncbi:uncharacterized protein LOC131650284 [Vicia villosa]|uniref:uncharacterized protein LOC131650284 n=1 Tax=Vicia villosa TaxID=3911 RepID=UPI00273CEB4B|nr:uncharacterized protein LOC131650284 [Vicia villosa]
MARPIEAVKDINDLKDLWKIVVRCKHLWSVTGASNKEYLEMILVDSKLDMIQVSNNDFSFRSTKHSFKLVSRGSTLVKKTELDEIPVNYLSIHGLDSTIEVRFKSIVLVDIVRGVTEISQSQIIVDNNKIKVVFTLTNMSKEVVQWLTSLKVSQFDVFNLTFYVCFIQGDYPLRNSNAWNDKKLVINDVSIKEINNLKERYNMHFIYIGLTFRMLFLANCQLLMHNFHVFMLNRLKNYLPLLSSSSLQETTCVIVATLEKFECGQSGLYYDGCVECTRSVSLKDGKLMYYAKRISAEPVLRFKLKVLASDSKFKSKFIFWGVNCARLAGKFALQMKKDLIEHTSKLLTPNQESQDELIIVFEPLSASADYDHAIGNSGLTPSKRSLTVAVEDIERVQLSSTKLSKHIKIEK